jgi:hypothetical protein
MYAHIHHNKIQREDVVLPERRGIFCIRETEQDATLLENSRTSADMKSTEAHACTSYQGSPAGHDLDVPDGSYASIVASSKSAGGPAVSSLRYKKHGYAPQCVLSSTTAYLEACGCAIIKNFQPGF